MQKSRREFFTDVGSGMLIAGLGTGVAQHLGVRPAFADEGPEALGFGKYETLVRLMQETPADKLQPLLAERIRNGADLKEMVAAAALANARTFGGEDYIGFHTLMALVPAHRMAARMPEAKRALPVLKVLYRNAGRIQAMGGRAREVLHPVAAAAKTEGPSAGEALLAAVKRKDVAAAEGQFAASAKGKPADAFNDLLHVVEDGQEVHRVVLAARAWDLIDFVGTDHAHTMLRQSVRYCVKQESPRYAGYFAGARALLPKLMDTHKLHDRAAGTRAADDAWIEKMSRAIFEGPPEQAAGAVAEALAEGFSPDAIGEAIALAANQLVLRDKGRMNNETAGDKPAGSVHGDSIGVHASDSAHAWRTMAGVGNNRHRAACHILGAYQVAKDGAGWRKDFLTWLPHPLAEQVEKLQGKDAPALLREAEDAVRNKDQARAAAAVTRYVEAGGSAESAFGMLLGYAVSEDGALHAEKYFCTTADEFARTREKFRVRQLTALARVTASEFGKAAPGYADACKLMGV